MSLKTGNEEGSRISTARIKDIAVVHVNTARTWRGGEKQTLYLCSRLHAMGRRSFVVCQPGSALHRRLAAGSIPHFPVSMRCELDIIAAKRIAGIARSVQAGIIHLHTAHAHSLGILSRLFYRAPLVVSRRVDFSIRKNVLSGLKYRFADRYIAVSEAIGGILEKEGVPREKIMPVHSGVDFGDYADLDAGYLYDEFSDIVDLKKKTKLVNVAALTEQKDQETLLRAVHILKKNTEGFVLFIAGEGNLRTRLERLRDGLNLSGHVLFTGFRDDPLHLISFSDIFVLSSRWEGLGTSIIDAMALGKPIVATDAGGVRELVDHGRNGLLVSTENPQMLADALLSLIRDAKLRRRLSAGAARASKNFSIENTVNGTLEVYESLFA